MAKRPGVRQSDLEKAADAAARFVAIGLTPVRAEFGHEGGFALNFGANNNIPEDEIEAALAKFEAAHDHS